MDAPPCGQTDTCENITFPQLRLLAVTKLSLFLFFSVADLPGLVRGAHQNYGLGFSFLRHIQRCACLMYVLDLAVKDPFEQLDDLMFELNQYEENLAHRPHAIVANKIDLPGTVEKLKELQGKINLPVFPISAKKLLGTKELVSHIRHLYDEQRQNKEG